MKLVISDKSQLTQVITLDADCPYLRMETTVRTILSLWSFSA